MHFTIAASMKKRTITLEKFFFISFCFHFSRRIRSGRFLTLIFLYTYVLVIEIDILKPPCMYQHYCSQIYFPPYRIFQNYVIEILKIFI